MIKVGDLFVYCSCIHSLLPQFMCPLVHALFTLIRLKRYFKFRANYDFPVKSSYMLWMPVTSGLFLCLKGMLVNVFVKYLLWILNLLDNNANQFSPLISNVNISFFLSCFNFCSPPLMPLFSCWTGLPPTQWFLIIWWDYG